MPSLEFKGKQFVYAHHLGVPFRTLVSAYAAGVSKLEVTNCDRKARPRRAADGALCVYRIGRGHAIERAAKSARDASQHRHHANYSG